LIIKYVLYDAYVIERRIREDMEMIEAKALLKSTNMTVQQIADELNFFDQSIFGKYFKRIVGVSPREYKVK